MQIHLGLYPGWLR